MKRAYEVVDHNMFDVWTSVGRYLEIHDRRMCTETCKSMGRVHDTFTCLNWTPIGFCDPDAFRMELCRCLSWKRRFKPATDYVDLIFNGDKGSLPSRFDGRVSKAEEEARQVRQVSIFLNGVVPFQLSSRHIDYVRCTFPNAVITLNIRSDSWIDATIMSGSTHMMRMELEVNMDDPLLDQKFRDASVIPFLVSLCVRCLTPYPKGKVDLSLVDSDVIKEVIVNAFMSTVIIDAHKITNLTILDEHLPRSPQIIQVPRLQVLTVNNPNSYLLPWLIPILSSIPRSAIIRLKVHDRDNIMCILNECQELSLHHPVELMFSNDDSNPSSLDITCILYYLALEWGLPPVALWPNIWRNEPRNDEKFLCHDSLEAAYKSLSLDQQQGRFAFVGLWLKKKEMK
jgi:hypothetical protein